MSNVAVLRIESNWPNALWVMSLFYVSRVIGLMHFSLSQYLQLMKHLSISSESAQLQLPVQHLVFCIAGYWASNRFYWATRRLPSGNKLALDVMATCSIGVTLANGFFVHWSQNCSPVCYFVHTLTFWVDYCNSLLLDLPATQTKRLQIALNSAAGIRTPKFHSYSQVTG